MKLKNKDLIAISDLNKEEVELILAKTKEFKSKKDVSMPLKGNTLAMIFEKPSTRTRVSFEVAMYQLGGLPIVLNSTEIQLSRGETVHDTAKVLSRYVDGVTIRTFSHNNCIELAKHADIPVINALSDFEHPCQALADIYTIMEQKGLKGTKVAYIGDGDNNVTNSLMMVCSLLDVDLKISSPEGYAVSEKAVKIAKGLNKNAKIEILNDPKEAVKGADVVYTDVWVSMGFEKEYAKRKKDFKDFQLNENLLKYTGNKKYIVMHCLPAHRGDEITDEVMDGNNSVVFDQAENRLHVQKAILFLLLGGKNA